MRNQNPFRIMPLWHAWYVIQEMSDTILSLGRMRTEKQLLIERLTKLEQQHSQLQLQKDQLECYRERFDEQKRALNAERQVVERIQRLLRGRQGALMEKL